MRLDVAVIRPEQPVRALTGEVLDLVHELAASVIAAPGIAFRVLVRHHAAGRLEDPPGHEVLARDQLETRPLSLELPVDRSRHRGIRLAERPRVQGADGSAFRRRTHTYPLSL